MSPHTPGPWQVKPTTARWHPSNSTGDLIVAGPQIIGEIWLGGNREANARLIAAAPEMYELLNLLRDADFKDVGLRSNLFDLANQARALLAKVRGEA